MRILTGIKPTGSLTLGNYVAVLKHMKEFNNEGDSYIFIADLHSLTVPIEPSVLLSNIHNIAAFYLASGLNPSKVTLFRQSDVSEHSELYTILQNYAYLGELSRMHQYKERTQNEKGSAIGLGILTYPVLMAADILLYKPDVIPVGEDQKQHVELAVTLAHRFNNRFGETFVIPKARRNKTGAKIMSLSEPTKKMSKSDPKGDIFLLDSEKVITKKIMSAVTDLGSQVTYDPINKPGISNLLTIYATLNDLSISEAEKRFVNYRYGDFKKEVAKTICRVILPLQKKYYRIIESDKINRVLLSGAKKARVLARQTLLDVKQKIGLL